MKINTLLPVLFFFMFGTCHAQTLSTKETKVVLAVSSRTGTITHMVLLHTFENPKREEDFKEYSDRKFYVGLLKGSYEIKNDVVVPLENTMIIMYTDQRIFPKENFSPADRLIPGDRFDLGKTKAKVVSSKKGELVLRT